MIGKVLALCRSETHTMSKPIVSSLTILKGLGVESDAHQGVTVKHRSRVARDPSQPNLRQVHLIHAELHDELKAKGFNISAGQMGENITTRGISLLDLPKGTLLHIGETVILEVTGLRNPCHQLDVIQQGLMQAVLDKDAEGHLIRKAGIMTVVVGGGEIFVDDEIKAHLPVKPYKTLEVV